MKQIAQIQVENHNRVPLDISVLENYEAIRPMLAVRGAILKQIRNI